MKKKYKVASLIGIIFTLAILWFVPWVFVLYFGGVIYFPYEADGSSRFVRITGPAIGFLNKDNWAKEKDIPKSCRAALIAAEDTRFYEHAGVDFASIEMAMKRNERRGKIRWGGSTITQQLVKNVFLNRKRSYLRKAREATGAVFLDAIMRKDLQVTWYFNVVEFGPRLYGINAAAKHYFHKPPARLNLNECVMLVSLLPDPKKSHRAIEKRVLPRYLQARYNRIINRLRISQPAD